MKAYLDNAATTPVLPEVAKEISKYLTIQFGNPSSVHSWGQEVREAVDQARAEVADFFGARPDELVFTSCATESINLAHKGLVEYLRKSEPRFKSQLPHVITTAVEHKAVLKTCDHLKKAGLAEVTYLPVDKDGLVSVSEVKKAMQPNTALVSVIYVNNEVGTVEPLVEIGQFLKEHNAKVGKSSRVYFHTDATQAIQYLDCRVDKLGVDLLSFTGHKFHAPKGIGGLYVRQGVPLVRQQDGGGQEDGLRSGTENTAFIIGLAKALSLVGSKEEKEKNNQSVIGLRDRLIAGVLKIPGTRLTGHPQKRAPHLASFTIEGVEGESVLLLLDSSGIGASSGSACNSDNLAPSHVLVAMGIAPEVAHGSLRLSLSRETTEKEVDYVLSVLPKIVDQLRKMAPKNLKGLAHE